MTKYIALIFVVATVLCSSLAYPFRGSKDFVPTDEAQLHRYEDKERESHEIRHGAFWNDEATLRRDQKKGHSPKNKDSSLERFKRQGIIVDPDTLDLSDEDPVREPFTPQERLKGRKLAEDIADRFIVVEMTVASVKESLREQLRNRLKYEVRNNWKSLQDFMAFCANEKVKAELRSIGIDLDKMKHKSDSESDEDF